MKKVIGFSALVLFSVAAALFLINKNPKLEPPKLVLPETIVVAKETDFIPKHILPFRGAWGGYWTEGGPYMVFITTKLNKFNGEMLLAWEEYNLHYEHKDVTVVPATFQYKHVRFNEEDKKEIQFTWGNNSVGNVGKMSLKMHPSRPQHILGTYTDAYGNLRKINMHPININDLLSQNN